MVSLTTKVRFYKYHKETTDYRLESVIVFNLPGGWDLSLPVIIVKIISLAWPTAWWNQRCTCLIKKNGREEWRIGGFRLHLHVWLKMNSIPYTFILFGRREPPMSGCDSVRQDGFHPWWPDDPVGGNWELPYPTIFPGHPQAAYRFHSSLSGYVPVSDRL